MLLHELVDYTASYVTGLFEKYQTVDLLYHNLEHTQSVVKRTQEIAANYSLKEIELGVLFTSAWFHDTGHLFGSPDLHEEKSASIMRSHFQKLDLENKIINEVEDCILATRIPHQAKSLLEEIICDADTYNLATKDFIRTDALLERELKLRNSSPPGNWEQNTMHLLEQHKFYTPYCKSLLNERKQINMNIIRLLLKNKK